MGEGRVSSSLDTFLKARARERLGASVGGVSEPEAVLRGWFDAFAQSDLDAARQLLADDAPLHPGPAHPSPSDPRGFDEFMAWYQHRRSSLGEFTYELRDLVMTQKHAVAFIALRAVTAGFTQEWQQVAVYRVERGQIEEVWLFEDER